MNIKNKGGTQGDVIVDGTSCLVSDTIVLGNVTVINSPTFVMLKCQVFGIVTVKGGEDTVIAKNQFANQNIVVEETTVDALLSNNVIEGTGDMVIRNNIIGDSGQSVRMLSYRNLVGGDITCANNEGGALARANIALGEIRCPGQLGGP